MKNSLKKPAYIINMRDKKPQSLTVVIDSKTYNLTNGHCNFMLVAKELSLPNPDLAKIIRLMDAKTAMAEFSFNLLQRRGDKVFYNGHEVQNVLVERINDFMKLGLPWWPIWKFLGNVLQNPREHSQQFVYTFLENEHLPLTPDGCFLGYKGVQKDFWSVHTGRHTMIKGRQNETGHILNSVGQSIEVPYDEVLADPEEPCGRGLHIGSYNYAKGWAGQEGMVVLVQCNPKHVVSVPNLAHEVLRACAYEVKDLVWGEPLKQKFETQYYNVRDEKGKFVKDPDELPW